MESAKKVPALVVRGEGGGGFKADPLGKKKLFCRFKKRFKKRMTTKLAGGGG